MKERVEQALPRQVREHYLAKFGIVLGAITLVVVLVSVGFYLGLDGTVKEDARSEIRENAGDETGQLEDWLEEHQRNAGLIASLEVMSDPENGDLIWGTLKRELTNMPNEVRQIHYVDLKEGEVMYSSDPSMGGTDVTPLEITLHEQYVGGANEASLTEVNVARLDSTYSDTFEWNGDRVIAFVSSIEGTNNAIMIVVDVDDAGEQFHNPIDGGYTEVVDATDGDVMLADDSNRTLATYGEGPDDDLFANSDLEPQIEQRDGELVAYARADRTDWVLVSHSPTAGAYSVATTVRNAFVVLIGVIVVGFALLGATMGRSTATALHALSEDATALAEGDLDVEITDSGRIDEVGRVEQSFRETQAYLQTVADQAQALAWGEFDSDALDQDVPGQLGQSLETMRTDLKQYVERIETAQQEAERAQNEAEALADELEAQAAAFGDTVARAADGDLTQRIDDDVDNEAMASIARSFNDLLDELEPIVRDLQELAETVDDTSEDVAAGADEIAAASDGVSEAAEEISVATGEQTDSFEEVQSEMGRLSATIEEVASTSDEVATAAQRAADNTGEIAEQADAVVDEMDDLETTARTIAGEIEGLGEEIERIETVVDVIDDIAEQTGILALNASIEAARADDASRGDGDGFAVIADEVKTLADETADSTEEIESLIEDVQTAAADVIEDATTMREQVADSAERVQSSLVAIEEVSDSVDDVNDRVQTVNDATDEQADTAQAVVTLVDEATEHSERTDAEANSVAETVEKQAASTDQVSESAADLSASAQRLRTMLDTFDVRAGDESAREGATSSPDATRTSSAGSNAEES